jgi:hypothetical protein
MKNVGAVVIAAVAKLHVSAVDLSTKRDHDRDREDATRLGVVRSSATQISF